MGRQHLEINISLDLVQVLPDCFGTGSTRKKRRRRPMSDYTDNEEITTIRESIAAFLLSCKVEGKSFISSVVIVISPKAFFV